MSLFGSGTKVSQPQNGLTALTIQQSAYGTPINLVYGTNRVYGNMLWYGAFQANLVSTGGGGGGGKGGPSADSGSSEYQYYASFALGLCEGPITGINNVYISKQVSNIPNLGGAVFTGTQAQAPWGYLTSNFPGFDLTYTELAYVGFANYFLGTSSDMPQFSFETQGLLVGGNGSGQDCDAAAFIEDFLVRAGFPSAYIGDFSALATYCRANGFFISPLINQQKTAIDWLNEIMQTLNCEFVWSNGALTAVPYGDSVIAANGVTYTPNLTPEYTLTNDNYLRDGDEDPIQIERKDLSDVYNQVPIEYMNRADQYNTETYTAFDDALSDMFGLRIAATLSAHHVTDPLIAQLMAQIWMNRQIYTRNIYTIKLPWNYILLDPMDYIAVPDPTNLSVNILLRITDIEEDEKDGDLAFTLEEVPGQIAAPAVYPTASPERAQQNYGVDPGDINPPIIFESPLALVQASDVEIDIAISGQNVEWGGCNIWTSTDGVNYSFLKQVNGQSRMGVLTSALPAYTPPVGGNNIDTVNSFNIDMTESRGTFNAAAAPLDAQQLNTLCYVDGELLAFGADTLIGTNQYTLSYLNRGAYQSPISSHPAGALFARLDQTIFRYSVDQSRVGQTVYFKFLSFNVWGGGIQSLDEVTPYNYTVTGSALLTPLANPTNLSVSYVDNIARLSWTQISDIRYPVIYQIRKGATFANAQVIGATTATNYLVYGTDTYWVTALYYTPFNVAVYSSSPPSVSVTTPSIAQYLIESHEEDPAWTGTVSGGAEVVGSVIQLSGINILAQANVLPIPNILGFSGVAASGTYTIPAGNIITTADISNAKVIVNWTLTAVSTLSDVTALTDIPTTPDITGEVSSTLVMAIPQIQVSQDGGSTWSAWQNWVPGVYPGNAWNFQIVIMTLDPSVNAILSTFGYNVDVPLTPQTGTATTSGSATVTVNFTNTFNIVPYLTITIDSQQSGDYYVLGTETASSFQIDVFNGVSRVVRTISYTATGY